MQMKQDEFKKKFMEFGNHLIDSYFPNDDKVVNRLVNNTCKYIFKNKINEIDPIIHLFANDCGEIDIMDFVSYMQTNMIGDGLQVNLRDYVKSGPLSQMLPDRTLVITKDDLNSFLSCVQ